MVAMTFNFWLNNLLTYRDKKLGGADGLFWGWLRFCGDLLGRAPSRTWRWRRC